MKNWLRFCATLIAVVFVCAAPAMAAEGTSISFRPAFGAGLVVIGAAFGIGRIGSASVEAMARQPEVAQKITVAMVIAAALIEGFTFYAIVVCGASK